MSPVHFLQAADGTNISLGINKEWADYIANVSNQGSRFMGLNRHKLGRIITAITYPGEPLDKFQAKNVVTRSNGVLTVALSKDFKLAKNRLVHALAHDPEFSKIKNIKGDVHLVGVFVMSQYQRSHISELMATLEQILFEIGLFSPGCYNIVKCIDGSEIIYSNKEEDWRTTAYIRECTK